MSIKRWLNQAEKQWTLDELQRILEKVSNRPQTRKQYREVKTGLSLVYTLRH